MSRTQTAPAPKNGNPANVPFTPTKGHGPATPAPEPTSPNPNENPTVSNAISKAAANGGNVLAVPTDLPGDDIFNSVANSGKYLARIQMFGGNSEAVKSGKVPMASYALVTGKDQYQPLGDAVDVVPVAWRPKAMDVGGEEVISVHDHTDPEFARIQAQSEVKDSGCMFGPEFLLWLPGIKRFVTLFMSSKTARREAPAIRERIGKPTTLGVEYIKTKKFSWHGIVARPCSTPFDLPTDEAVAEEVEKFMNPPKVDIERVQPEANTGRAR
jgi:hypothetical protein